MDMASLYYLIHLSGQKKLLSWRRRLKMLCDICRGLMCIHRTKIVPRDLKTANCLVNKHWTVKICDFGLSGLMTDAPVLTLFTGVPLEKQVVVCSNLMDICDSEAGSLELSFWGYYMLSWHTGFSAMAIAEVCPRIRELSHDHQLPRLQVNGLSIIFHKLQ
ncbi:PREDICTED: serine/threonine-protein kinase STY17-like [Ipomoea nil]|uniref:serine/threonine-protein kinase STY17-like n=1 Tax=Ipomoea nil TaxID=35883 RepID=UPI000901BAA0|nr:PREDICTED: serine/threonine-protein kinase STY17-like [Ipomoea nil]